MATNIEIEAKVLISESDYKRAIAYYSKFEGKHRTQTNYYIDTDDLTLKHYGIGLRIRDKGYFTLALKAPMSEGLLEKKESITNEQYLAYKNDHIFPTGAIQNFLLMLGINIDELHIQTSLVTERFQIKNEEENTIFSIDKNTYNGITDYELEMEGVSLASAQKCLEARCKELGIDYKINEKSKQVRAMETIKK